jgi:transcriptional regulator with PAS, ATPase and Fis domain
VIPISVPPLRERREDIPPLATHLLQRLCDARSRNITGISSEALKRLVAYDWPGNVRELENAIEYALHLTDDGQSIGLEQLPVRVTGANEGVWNSGDLVSIEEYTKRSIMALQADHSEGEISDILGITRKSLWEKRNRWSLPRQDKR